MEDRPSNRARWGTRARRPGPLASVRVPRRASLPWILEDAAERREEACAGVCSAYVRRVARKNVDIPRRPVVRAMNVLARRSASCAAMGVGSPTRARLGARVRPFGPRGRLRCRALRPFRCPWERPRNAEASREEETLDVAAAAGERSAGEHALFAHLPATHAALEPRGADDDVGHALGRARPAGRSRGHGSPEGGPRRAPLRCQRVPRRYASASTLRTFERPAEGGPRATRGAPCIDDRRRGSSPTGPLARTLVRYGMLPCGLFTTTAAELGSR